MSQQQRASLSEGSKACLAASDYVVPTMSPGAAVSLISLSVLSTVIVTMEIIRLTVGGSKKKASGRDTPIGMLVRKLVCR